VWDLGSTTGTPLSLAFNNLTNGNYSVYVYAMAPDSSTFITNVNINAAAGAGNPGNQQVGGLYPGGGNFALGVTHSLHQVVVSNGSMTINLSTASGFGSLARIQLLIPAPGAHAVFGLAGMMGSRRRRN
jgi:hypothetical protein